MVLHRDAFVPYELVPLPDGKPFTCNHLWNPWNLRFTSESRLHEVSAFL